MSALEDFKSSFHRYLPGGLTVILVKKEYKIKYGFVEPISNVDLGLFQLLSNQLMFRFFDTLVLLNHSNCRLFRNHYKCYLLNMRNVLK